MRCPKHSDFAAPASRRALGFCLESVTRPKRQGMIALDLPYGGRPSRRSFHAPGGVSALKSHNILIEPWQETSSFTYERGGGLFRWTVSYEKTGVPLGKGPVRPHPQDPQA